MKTIRNYVLLLILGGLMGWIIAIFTPNASKEKIQNNDDTSLWTCAMHPQIQLPKFGDCPICGMDLIPLEKKENPQNPQAFTLSESAMARANIQTTRIQKTSHKTIRMKLSGKIAENENAKSVQVSYFSGRIEQLYVNSVGEEIKKGRLIATLYAPELISAQQELITTSALKETDPELYKAVRNKLKLWKISEDKIDEIEKSGNIQQYFPIYANVSGTVTQTKVAQGDVIVQGQTLLILDNLKTVWAEFDVYENQIEKVKINQPITLTFPAFPNAIQKAKVNFIEPALNPTTRTVKLRVEIKNPDRKLKLGMIVAGVVTWRPSHNEDMLTIPATAVLWTGDRSIVYIKNHTSEPIFEMKEITIGKKRGDDFEVIEGLKEGDEIVTHGTFTVDAEAQLLGKKSMMNRMN